MYLLALQMQAVRMAGKQVQVRIVPTPSVDRMFTKPRASVMAHVAAA